MPGIIEGLICYLILREGYEGGGWEGMRSVGGLL
jgi:hypothetical protein